MNLSENRKKGVAKHRQTQEVFHVISVLCNSFIERETQMLNPVGYI